MNDLASLMSSSVVSESQKLSLQSSHICSEGKMVGAKPLPTPKLIAVILQRSASLFSQFPTDKTAVQMAEAEAAPSEAPDENHIEDLIAENLVDSLSILPEVELTNALHDFVDKVGRFCHTAINIIAYYRGKLWI